MNTLRTYPFATEYRSSRGSIADEFVVPALARAKLYLRAAGYFRSSVYWTLEDGLRPFIERGGRIRIVCSSDLNESDVRAITQAYKSREKASEEALLRELDHLMTIESVQRHLEVYATLVKFGVVEVKVAIYSKGRGIFHEKIGVFSDDTDAHVSFKGSSNESWMGWHPDGNLESVEVFASWEGDREARRVEGHRRYLTDLWKGQEPGISVHELPDAVKKRLLTYASDDLDSVSRHRPVPPKPGVASRPKIKPLDHQQQTMKSWIEAGCRGIAKHATGSGKTITGILALQHHLEKGGVGIVVVPSALLLRQWYKELGKFLPDVPVLRAGDGHTDWKGEALPNFTMPLESRPRIVLAVNNTARSDDFLSGVEPGDHLMLLADEVHRLGSSDNQRILGIGAAARLGLSATPERAGDPDGTAAVQDYFGSTLKPVVTLRDAIDAGRLVEYEYHVHTADLSDEEIEAWRRLSTKIAVAIGKGDEGGRLSDSALLLLIERAKIMKKAASKVPVATEILAHKYAEGERWLVYCEDRDQMDQLRANLGRQGLKTMQYHSGMADNEKEATLEWFYAQGGVIVSIRCLDEGVDIPSVTHALIIASSQNPREFVQRRGRVLREASRKSFATVHDVLVLPPISVDDERSGDVSRRIAASEFGRAAVFAKDAMNATALVGIERILLDMGFSVDEVAELGIQDQSEVGE